MKSVFEVDRRLYLLFHSRVRAGWLDPIMVWLTKAGTKGVLWLGLAAGLLVDGSPHARLAALASIAALLIAEGLINMILKPSIRRERPFAGRSIATLLVSAPGPHSWPSAHAGSSLAAAVVLAYAYPWWSILFLAVALLIAHSRIYVGVHYPLDVAAGIVVGVIAGVAVIVAVVIAGTVTHIPSLT